MTGRRRNRSELILTVEDIRVPWLQGVLRLPDLPGKEATDQLLRYESYTRHALFKTMDQLERLQRRR